MSNGTGDDARDDGKDSRMRFVVRWPLRYAVAVLAILAAAVILQLPVIAGAAGSVLFLAVLVAAWYGGFGPGVLATVLIVALAIIDRLTNDKSFGPTEIIAILLFATGGVLVALLVEALHAARRRAEENGRWLAAVLTSIGDAVIATDADGRVSFTNPVAGALTGYQPESMAGQPLEEVFRLVREPTGEPVEDPGARVLREGVPIDLGNHMLLIAADGTTRPIADSAAPIRDDRGEIRGVVLVFRDVTERRRRMAALRASEERFRLALGSGAVTVFEQDAELRYTWLYPLDPALSNRPLGQTDLELLPTADGEELMRLKREVLTSGQEQRQIVRVELPRGLRYYDLAIEPRRDETGRVIGVCGAALDVTDRKLVEEALQEADRRKDEFLAMLAHELRNPLSAIHNAIELAGTAGWESWSQEVLERQVRHLAHMIDDLLDVARLARGKFRLRREVLELTPVLESAARAVRSLVETRKHRLEVVIDPMGLVVEGDPTRLEQVVVNLLVNAAKYTESGGRIALSAERSGDEIIIQVRDNGVGLPPEALPAMFEPFAQGDRSLARSEGGLGIGLTLVKGLVELHRGTIEAASDGPGLGSLFTVRLPASAPVGDGNGETAPRWSVQPVQGPSRRILIVDDNADSARGLSRLLALLGHDVQTAHDGREALDVVDAQRPEYVLLDIGLPGMDGYEVARRLRAGALGPELTLIAVSGYGQEEDRRRSREAGIDHHLVKPVDHEALLGLLVRGQEPVRGDPP